MFYILKIIISLLARLPFGVLYALSDLLCPVVYHILRYRRKVVRKNLTLAFPEKSDREIIKLEKKFYRFFCDLFVEVIRFSGISEKKLLKHLEGDLTIISEILDRGQSVILMTAHYGNWEWGSALPLFMDKKYKSCNIYKALNNKHFMGFMNKMRSRFGAKNIETKVLLREMLRLRNDGQPAVFSLISDQRPKRHNIHLRLNFLNCDTAAITGTEELARKFDYPVVFASMNRVKRGLYKIELCPAIKQPSKLEEFEITKRYFSYFEKKIQENPEFWLWTHNRWKF